jgi:branched-chain amino acid transport system ATP-binding protein
MKVILGLFKPRSGDVMLDGQSLLSLSTPQIIRRGIGSVPEARRLFGTMTVRENVLMGAYTRNDRPEIDADYDRMMTLFPRLAQRASQAAGTLSGGEQQMVAMARALMGRPRVLCMDEPTMGLSPLFVDRVLELIQTVNKTGVTIFMVEQNANLALRIADHGYVLQAGRIALAGPARDLLHDPRIRDAYLGGQAA